MRDRFSQAYAELPDRNPYICDSCTTLFGHATVEPIDERQMRGEEQGQSDIYGCLLNCDPLPFGD